MERPEVGVWLEDLPVDGGGKRDVQHGNESGDHSLKNGEDVWHVIYSTLLMAAYETRIGYLILIPMIECCKE